MKNVRPDFYRRDTDSLAKNRQDEQDFCRIYTNGACSSWQQSCQSCLKKILFIFWKNILGNALLIVIIFALASCAAKKEEEKKEEVVVSVKIAQAERTSIAEQATAVGTIAPRQQAVVSAKISAPIARMTILKNKFVKAGEVIATLEARDLQAQRTEALAALQEANLNLQGLNKGSMVQANSQAEKDLRDAKANVENARAVYERRKKLFDQNGLSLKELESSQLALTTAENQLKLAESAVQVRTTAINPNDKAVAENRVKAAEERVATLDTQLSYATIRAPYDGVVTDQFQFQGEYAAAGAKLVNIADLSEVIVKAPFPDTVAAHLRVGETALVTPAESPEQKLSGRVSLISPASDPTNRTIEIWVSLPNPNRRLRAGGAATVVFPTKTVSDAIVIPASAVTLDATNADKGVVMVVDKKMIAHETKVTIGIRTGNKIEITEGLQGDETVVIEGGYALPDGTKVQVAEEKDEKDDKEKKDDKDEKQDAKEGDKK